MSDLLISDVRDGVAFLRMQRTSLTLSPLSLRERGRRQRLVSETATFCSGSEMSVRLTEQTIREVRQILEHAGPSGLRVDDLTVEDLPHIRWSGSPTHIASVVRALDRVESGEVEYLAVRAPAGEPIAKCCIDYAARPNAATISQVATAEELQDRGIGTHLMAVAEERIRNRGAHVAELAVEDSNPRARALYERLGYREVRRERASWDREDPQGNVTPYQTELAVLRKEL
jgi:ribosomal protein S18 acetylase RimI-like enzyme